MLSVEKNYKGKRYLRREETGKKSLTAHSGKLANHCVSSDGQVTNLGSE